MKELRLSTILLLILYVSIFFLPSCNNEEVHGKWINGTEKEQIEIIERQFRGFDAAMVEVGYRYQELYWAGQDENWEYARY